MKQFWIGSVCLLLVCGGPGPAYGQESGVDEIYFRNGDRVTGHIVREDQEQIVLEHNGMGTVAIGQGSVSRIVRAERAHAPDVPTEPEPVWQREVTFGYNLSRGNTEDEEFAVKVLTNRKTAQDELTAEAEGLYAASSRRMNAQRYRAMVRYAFSFGPRLAWYNFYTVEGDHDRFANVDWRFTPSTGVGYWFADQQDWKAMAEVALGWDRTEFRSGTTSRSDLVLIPRAFVQKSLFGQATLSQDVILWPNLSDRGEYRLRAQTTLRNPLSEALSLQVRFIDEFQSDPAQGSDRNDARLMSSLVYAF